MRCRSAGALIGARRLITGQKDRYALYVRVSHQRRRVNTRTHKRHACAVCLCDHTRKHIHTDACTIRRHGAQTFGILFGGSANILSVLISFECTYRARIILLALTVLDRWPDRVPICLDFAG